MTSDLLSRDFPNNNGRKANRTPVASFNDCLLSFELLRSLFPVPPQLGPPCATGSHQVNRSTIFHLNVWIPEWLRKQLAVIYPNRVTTSSSTHVLTCPFFIWNRDGTLLATDNVNAEARARTHDIRIGSPTLCRLSCARGTILCCLMLTLYWCSHLDLYVSFYIVYEL